MNKTKIILLVVLLIGCLVFFNRTTKANFTDFIPNIGVVRVEYLFHFDAGAGFPFVVDGPGMVGGPPILNGGLNFVFNVVLPGGATQMVLGGLDQNNRGVPDLTGLTDPRNPFYNPGSPLINQTLKAPPRRQEDHGILDSSERREAHFRATHLGAFAQSIMAGYPSGELRPDERASMAEFLTVMIRTDASLQGDRTYVHNPHLAWDRALGMLGGENLRGFTSTGLRDELRKHDINMSPDFFNQLFADVGNRVITREDLIRAADSLLAGQRFDDRRVIGDPRVDDPRVPDDPRVDDPRVDDPRVDHLRPTCISFYSDWPRIMYRQTSNLRWNCVNLIVGTDRCVITKDVGRVGNFVHYSEVGPVGERIVSPQRSTTYRLTCFRGNQSSVPQETTIRVLAPGLREMPPGIQPQ